ncbi:TPA: hypothetical protein ACIBLQ_004621, partial [Salmonella enterica subsp. enterica serovar Birkenhead]
MFTFSLKTEILPARLYHKQRIEYGARLRLMTRFIKMDNDRLFSIIKVIPFAFIFFTHQTRASTP